MTLPPFWPGYNHTLLALPPKTAESWPNFGVIGVVSGDFPPLLLSANLSQRRMRFMPKSSLYSMGAT